MGTVHTVPQYSTVQCVTMRLLLCMFVCLYTMVVSSLLTNIQHKEDNLISRSSRQSPDCDSDICADCRADCSGCNNCRLCSLISTACAAGKKLKFQGKDVCAKCAHCAGGKEQCLTNCETGKTQPTCQHCINNCNR